ncbi:MAG: SiaC family regulatory phosphoprotein, partial [Bacteroidales bacterium]|nr:SiaC family regulatory phosphoprotein [Bacteroidales bacterium]
MLEPINIAATIDTPAIILDKSTGEMSFSGRSLPEDVLKIYQPVQNW